MCNLIASFGSDPWVGALLPTIVNLKYHVLCLVILNPVCFLSTVYTNVLSSRFSLFFCFVFVFSPGLPDTSVGLITGDRGRCEGILPHPTSGQKARLPLVWKGSFNMLFLLSPLSPLFLFFFFFFLSQEQSNFFVCIFQRSVLLFNSAYKLLVSSQCGRNSPWGRCKAALKNALNPFLILEKSE